MNTTVVLPQWMVYMLITIFVLKAIKACINVYLAYSKSEQEHFNEVMKAMK